MGLYAVRLTGEGRGTRDRRLRSASRRFAAIRVVEASDAVEAEDRAIALILSELSDLAAGSERLDSGAYEIAARQVDALPDGAAWQSHGITWASDSAKPGRRLLRALGLSVLALAALVGLLRS